MKTLLLSLCLAACTIASAQTKISGAAFSGITCGVVTAQVSAPTASPVAGSYTSTQSVTLATVTPGATIHFTTDGTTPTTSSPVYSSAITVATTQTVKALAVAAGYTNSNPLSAGYTITVSTVDTPVSTPGAGSYVSAQTVTLTDGTPAASMFYTTNGSTPTPSSTPYTAPISVSATQLLQVIATKAGFANSNILSAQYNIGTAPVFSLAGGTYTGTQTVPIVCPNGAQTATYRLDGGKVTPASPEYTGPLTLTSPGTYTVSAICSTIGAYQANVQQSSLGSLCHTALGGTWSGITCSGSGGVGTVNPSNLVWTFPGGSSPSLATITSPASTSSEVQALFIWFFGGAEAPAAPTCDSCTEQVKDITFTVQGSGMANQEFDSPQYDNTHGINRQNGMQCEIGPGLIYVDSGNAGGKWTATTAPCSSFTAGTTHEVVNSVSHVNGDTGCGGHGCANYNYVWIDGTNTTLNGNYSGTQGYNTQSGGKSWGWQFQPDMKPTGGSAVTGGWSIISATVALGMGDESATTTATYVIH